ncbi:OB-fold domain-containing protein [Nocardia sp. NPDC050193]
MTTLRPQPVGIPLPTPTPVSQPFWDGCAAGELRFQRCSDCGHAEFDPAWMCRACGGDALEWQVSGGLGEITSCTVVHRPQTPEFVVPYVVALVRFDEGFTMLTNVVDCTVDVVRTGLRVRTVFAAVGEGFALPYVQPDSEGNHGN